MVRYVRIKKFSELTGNTEKAVRRKIERGVFIEGLHYLRDPDGRIHIDMEAYKAWVENKNR